MKNITFLCPIRQKNKRNESKLYKVKIQAKETENKALEKIIDSKLNFQFIDIDRVFAN